MSTPVIPKRVSSLLPVSGHQEVNALLAKREFSTSQVSLASSAEEFLEAKLEDIKSNLEVFHVMKKHLSNGLEEGRYDRSEYNEAMEDLDEECEPRKREMVFLKRQQQILSDDLEDSLHHSKLEDLYVSLVLDVVMGASAKQI